MAKKKIQTPGSLRNLDGGRYKSQPINVNASKPPKRRFNPGDIFEFKGSHWHIKCMFRLKGHDGVWFHELEEIKHKETIGLILEALGAGATTPRIVYDEFYNYSDATQFFADIYRHGDSVVKTTQELLKLKKITINPPIKD